MIIEPPFPCWDGAPRAPRPWPRRVRCPTVAVVRDPEVAHLVAAHAPLAELREGLGRRARRAAPAGRVPGHPRLVRLRAAAERARTSAPPASPPRTPWPRACLRSRPGRTGSRARGRTPALRPCPAPRERPYAPAAGLADACTPASLLSNSSTIPYLRFFII